MDIVVQKYGGTSVSGEKRIQNIASRIKRDQQEGKRIVVVVSAPAGMTDNLINQAKSVATQADKREMDMLLSIGEQISSSLLAIALIEIGQKAISYNALQLSIETTKKHGNAQILSINTEKIQQRLEEGYVVVVTGFQGVTKFGDVTTLGRGGSDTTAVALGVALNTDIVEIYTDVDGVYSADPRIVSSAKKMHQISYMAMLEMAGLGAKVLHSRCVELAAKNKISIHLKSAFSDAMGTKVVGESHMEKTEISGVVHSTQDVLFSINGIINKTKYIADIFKTISQHDIAIDLITQNMMKNGTMNLSFVANKANADKLYSLCETLKQRLLFHEIVVDNQIARVSLVGIGVRSKGIAAEVFQELSNIDVDVLMISSSEINITSIVKACDIEKAVNCLHKVFIEAVE